MKKTYTFILLLIILSCFICGCKNNSTEKQVFYPYQKITQIETSTEAYNPQWLEVIKTQLETQPGLSESDIKKIINNSTFQRCSIEYATSYEYQKQNFPYCFKAEIIIWKSEESYYSICEIVSDEIESPNENMEIILEGQKEPWIEDFQILTVIPVNQSCKITMGSRISFVDNSIRTGPFIVVNTFYVSSL